MTKNKILIKNNNEDNNKIFKTITKILNCDEEVVPPLLNDFSQIIYSVLMPIVCLLGKF
jgi:hypothetical protein